MKNKKARHASPASHATANQKSANASRQLSELVEIENETKLPVSVNIYQLTIVVDCLLAIKWKNVLRHARTPNQT